jgi:hypothetical protein
MPSPALAPPVPLLRAADRLWWGSALLLAIMPLGMALAHRSAPVFVTLSAALAVGASLADGRAPEIAARLRAWLSTPVAIATGAFLALALLSQTWSEARGTTLFALGEFLLPLGAGLVLAASLPQRAPKGTDLLLAASLIAAAALIVLDLGTGLAWRAALGIDAESFIFNRPTLTILLFGIVLVGSTAVRAPASIPAPLALAVAAAAAGLLAATDSDAALLGLGAAALTALLAWRRRKAALVALALGWTLLVAGAPVLGSLLRGTLPTQVHALLPSAHTEQRVLIWESFGEVVRSRPLLGTGFGSSARLAASPVAQELPPDLRSGLSWGHPHNVALQVWTELGALGAALAWAVGLAVIAGLSRLTGPVLVPAAALFAAVVAVASVGHGAWQGWWAAAIAAAIVALCGLPARPKDGS